MKPHLKTRLKSWMKRKISFRWHMTFMMMTTIALGAVTNIVLYNLLGVHHPALRYPLTVLIAYGWFFLIIRLYLTFILERKNSGEANIVDGVDLIPNDFSSSNHSTFSLPEIKAESWTGQGGSFSGGGASGSWGEATEAVSEAVTDSALSVADDEAGGILILVVIGILGIAIFGSGAYFIWHSPEILSECLLQVLMVSGIQNRLKNANEKDWMGHLFQATYKPVLFVVIASVVAGAVLRVNCPFANNIREVRTGCASY
jgi:hypothetical protein